VPEPGPPPYNTGAPVGATYDPATGRFYYVDALLDNVWAADTTGAVLPGYPRTLAARPGAYLGNSADAHGGADPAEGGDPAGVRIEVLAGPVDTEYDAVVVTDEVGRDFGVETPLPVFPGNGYARGWSARSRWDPNGLMYATYFGRNEQGDPRPGVAAIRPAPLSPTWLGLAAWNGQAPAGGSSDLALTFRAGSRAPGEYRTVLVVEDPAGAVLAEVPLVLAVTPGTPAEPGPDRARASLSVSPNPSRGAATVALTLPAPARARVAVFDVLGRQVAVLQEGPLGAGLHALALPVLPIGAYVVRAAIAGAAPAAARFVVAR
jgi:hypothetical protein